MRTAFRPDARRLRRWIAAGAGMAAALALAASACNDAHSPTAPAADAPLAARSDTLSTPDGIAVALLPPLAPARATYPGVFDSTRSPVVDVCAWSGTACVGSPVAHYDATTTTPRVTVSGSGQYYRVDWPTGGITRGQLYRILISDGTTRLAYADAQQPAAGQTAAQLAAQNIVALGNGSALAIRFRMQQVPPATRLAVAITQPAADSQYVASGAAVTLSGTATDPVDGDVSARIVWTSSLATAALGTGASISVTLPVGPQTITATATNKRGDVGTATRYLTASLLASSGSITVPYSGTASLPITVPSPAPAGGIVLAVVSSDTTLVKVTTPSVTIPAGSRSVNATLQGVGVGSANVSATNATYGRAVTRANVSADLRFTERYVNFPAGRTQSITVGLQSAGSSIAAPRGGFVVGLAAADSGCLRVPATVTIPAGLVNTSVTLAYGGTSAAPCDTRIAAFGATNPAVTRDSIQVVVTSSPTLSFNYLPTYLGAGLRGGQISYVLLGAPAPVGGVVVTVASSDSSRILVSPAGSTPTVGHGSAAISVPAGQSSASFYVDGLEGASGTSATLSATAQGFATTTSSISVTRPGIGIAGLQPTTTLLTGSTAFSAYVGPTYTSGSAAYISGPQPIRPGGSPITVTVRSSQPSVGQIKTTSATAQSATATIPVGQQNTPADLARGGLAFLPTGGGTTTVTASAPGTVAASQSAVAVTVGAPTMTLNYVPTYLGAGLRAGQISYVQLAVPAPTGGVTVAVASSDSTKLLLAPASSTPTVGRGSIALPIAAGQTTATFYVDGVEGQTGNATFAASAPGFTTVTSSPVPITRIGLGIASLGTTSTTQTPATAFYAYAGPTYTSGSTTYVSGAQPVRPGGTPIRVTFTSSQPTVGQIRTSAATAQSATATIAAGQQNTPVDLASGGVAFQPTGGGTTTVTATTPGAVPVAQSTVTVAVSAPTFTFSYLPTYLGAGLRAGIAYAQLGAPAPSGGLNVTIASSDPSRMLVAPAGSTPVVGRGSVVIAVPAGQQYATFYVDGVEGQTGNATLTASAAGYTSTASAAVAVTQRAVVIAGLSPTSTTLTPASPFYAYVGPTYASGGTLYVSGAQPVRPGGTPIAVRFTNTQSAVAQLRTNAGAAQTSTATIAVGQQNTPTDLASGGVAFQALGGGTTTVSATAPGAATVAQSAVTVTVSAPTLSFYYLVTSVGAGLRSGLGYVQLGAPAPAGGVTVTVTSSAPSALVVAPSTNPATVGTGSVSIAVPAGQSYAPFYVDGIENQSGTVNLTAAASGFTNGRASVTVAPVGVAIAGLPSSLASTAVAPTFYAYIGPTYLSGNVTYISGGQSVRPGGRPITVRVASSQPSVGQIKTAGATAPSATATIAVGQQNTPTDLASGGVAFQPTGAGNTTVTVGGSGLTTVAQSSQGVTVTASLTSATRASARVNR